MPDQQIKRENPTSPEIISTCWEDCLLMVLAADLEPYP